MESANVCFSYNLNICSVVIQLARIALKVCCLSTKLCLGCAALYLLFFRGCLCWGFVILLFVCLVCPAQIYSFIRFFPFHLPFLSWVFLCCPAASFSSSSSSSSGCFFFSLINPTLLPMTHLCPCSLFSVSLSFYSSKYAVLTLEFLKYSWMHPCTDIGSWSSARTFRVGDKICKPSLSLSIF